MAENVPNPNQREARRAAQIEKIHKRIDRLKAQEERLLSYQTPRQRAEARNRTAALGQQLEEWARHDARARAFLKALIARIPDSERYLFPECWPEAQRPTKKRPRHTAAPANSAAPDSRSVN